MASWITSESLRARDRLLTAINSSPGSAAMLLREHGPQYSWLARRLDEETTELRPLGLRWVDSDVGWWPVASYFVIGEEEGRAFGLSPSPDDPHAWRVISSLLHAARPMPLQL